MTTAPSSTPPMISVAGIRGIVGDNLRLNEFLDYALAMMAELKIPRLVVGGDTRASGPMLRNLVFAAGIASGLEIYDLGIVPTPTIGMMVRKLKAGGGIALTASHNPAQWNALKFFSSEGSFLKPEQLDRVLQNYAEKAFRRVKVAELGSVQVVEDPVGPHLETLMANLPVKEIRRRKFKVVLDACNGAGLEIAERLFQALNVEYQVVYREARKAFERAPEPLPENLGKLKRAVKSSGADIGFALDPDADRLALVDETGRAIGEERTITLAFEYVLRTSKRPVVVNLSTTRAVDDVAKRHGVRVERTPIGEAHVVNRMHKLKAEIGGEGNGGVIWPRVHPGRDSATGMGLLLALMSEEATGRKGKTFSQINGMIPDYIIVKDKVSLPERAMVEPALVKLGGALPDLETAYPDHKITTDTADGFKIILNDRWLHVRASGTEPIMRLFAEAPDAKSAQKLIQWAHQVVNP